MTYIVAADYIPERANGRGVEKRQWWRAASGSVRLSPAPYGELDGKFPEVVAEVRTLADGTPFLGLEVTSGEGPLLRWSTADPSTWVLPTGMARYGPGGAMDVTPRPGIEPGTVEALARSAAWDVGNRHNIARYEAMPPNSDSRPGHSIGPWDASDWAAAAERYWHEIALAYDTYRPPEVIR